MTEQERPALALTSAFLDRYGRANTSGESHVARKRDLELVRHELELTRITLAELWRRERARHMVGVSTLVTAAPHRPPEPKP